MSDPDATRTVRSKIIGVLLRDARQVRGLSLESCAGAAGCSGAALQAFENGEASPSLPELELLAHALDVPLTYFWGDKALSQQHEAARPALPAAEVLALRHRIVGALLRQARQKARIEIDQLAASVDLTPAELNESELGQTPVPLPELEALAAQVGVPIDHFLEAQGPLGEWDSTRRAFARFRQLPPELREFVSRPMNEGYLRLAQRLSQLPAGELRGIAASLLEITY